MSFIYYGYASSNAPQNLTHYYFWQNGSVFCFFFNLLYVRLNPYPVAFVKLRGNVYFPKHGIIVYFSCEFQTVHAFRPFLKSALTGQTCLNPCWIHHWGGRIKQSSTFFGSALWTAGLNVPQQIYNFALLFGNVIKLGQTNEQTLCACGVHGGCSVAVTFRFAYYFRWLFRK